MLLFVPDLYLTSDVTSPMFTELTELQSFKRVGGRMPLFFIFLICSTTVIQSIHTIYTYIPSPFAEVTLHLLIT